MKPILPTILLALLLPCLVQAQSWQKRLEFPGADEAFVIGQTPDGGFVFGGHTGSFRKGKPDAFDVFMAKTDAGGKLLWLKTLPGAFDEIASDGLVLPDGGLVLAGSKQAFADGGEEMMLVRFDPDGNAIWQKTYPGATGKNLHPSVRQTPDGGFVCGGSAGQPGGKDSIFILKTDADGQQQWLEVFDTFPEDNDGFDALPTPDGGYLAIGQLVASKNYFFLKTDSDGNVQWQKNYPVGLLLKMAALPGGGVLAVGQDTFSMPMLVAADANGDTLWTKKLSGEPGRIHDVEPTADGNFILSGVRKASPELEFNLALWKISPTGQVIFEKTFGTSGYEIGYAVAQTNDGGFAACGETNRDGSLFGPSPDVFLVKTDADGRVLANAIAGQVLFDKIGNCSSGDSTTALADWAIEARNTATQQRFFARTDKNGGFFIPVEQGDFEVRVFAKNQNWEICTPQQVSVSTGSATDTVLAANFLAKRKHRCSNLTVDLSLTHLQRGATNFFTVKYTNTGPDTAFAPHVEIEFDTLFNMVSSPALLGGGPVKYAFDLPDTLPPGSSGSFRVEAFLRTESQVGQFHAVRAHIFPDSVCEVSTAWDGSSVEVSGFCEGEKARFLIRNRGTGPTETLEFIIIEDVVLGKEFQNPSLGPGGELPLEHLAAGKTIRLEVRQADFHPGKSMPAVVLEGCRTDPASPFSKGFAAQMPLDDADDFIAIEGREAADAPPGIGLETFPRGVGSEHCIGPTTEIEYLVRFGNPGPDTLQNLFVLDTLPPGLDASSVVPGASSDDYDFSMDENGALRFELRGQFLPQAANLGFVKFRVRQKPDLPPGTLLENRAAVQFGFFEKTLTNAVWHRLDSTYLNCIDSIIIWVNTPSPNAGQPSVRAFPNPASGSATFDFLTEKTSQPVHFQLFDADGRLVDEQRTDAQKPFVWQRGQLPAGVYAFRFSGADFAAVGWIMLR